MAQVSEIGTAERLRDAHKSPLLVLIRDLLLFQETTVEVDAGGASLKLEKHSSCSCRAVDSATTVSVPVRDEFLGSPARRTVHTYGRPLYVSSPAR